MVSNVTPNLQVITREIFDLPCVLKAPKSFDTVDWKVSFFFIISLMENLLAKNSVSNLPENVWLHRSAIECSVQQNIIAVRRSQNLINSHSSFRQRIISFKEAKEAISFYRYCPVLLTVLLEIIIVINSFKIRFIDDLHTIQTLKYMKYTILLQASQIKTVTLRLTQLYVIFWLIFWTGTY